MVDAVDHELNDDRVRDFRCGATLRNDLDGNKELYGSRLTNKEVLAGDKEAPEAAKKLIAELDKYSMRKSN